MLPIAADFVVRATRAEAQSALPDAPILPDQPPTTATERRRIKMAGGLRRLADRLEPVGRPPNHAGAGS
jgi:hypothetical protein